MYFLRKLQGRFFFNRACDCKNFHLKNCQKKKEKNHENI